MSLARKGCRRWRVVRPRRRGSKSTAGESSGWLARRLVPAGLPLGLLSGLLAFCRAMLAGGLAHRSLGLGPLLGGSLLLSMHLLGAIPAALVELRVG